MRAPGLVPFETKVKESDLFILAEKDLREVALASLRKERENLEAYLRYDPRFGRSLEPVEVAPFAPPICQLMAQAAQAAQVGPMAAVAGAVNEMVAQELLLHTGELLIENGGDLLVISSERRLVALYAGVHSPFSFRVGVRLPAGRWGVATSSGTVGPSLSFGKADAVMVVSPSAAFADAWATSLGNEVREKGDVKRVLQKVQKLPHILGVVIAISDVLGVEGNLELEKL